MTLGRCNVLHAHVRTGAADDIGVHWPCDRELIERMAFSAEAWSVAERLGVTKRTVVRWRAKLRQEP